VCAIAGAVCITLALGACSGDDPASTPTTPNTAPPLTALSPSLVPSSAPAALTPAEAEARAQAAVEDYLALFAEISADPQRDLAELETVARDRALDWATHQITTWRNAGQTGVGAQIASDFRVTAVDLDPDKSEVGYPSVALTACVDLSNTDLIDENGNSVVPADRPDRVLVDYTVANIGWPDDQQWRVVRDDDQLTNSDPPEFVPCP
jgi:hypothetical protein